MPAWTNPTTVSPPSRGLLRPEVADSRTRRSRIDPAPDLAAWVDHYWTVEWRLDVPFVTEVVSHPSVHVTIETGTSPRYGFTMPCGLVHGVVTRRFSVELAGTGSVFGVKFRPGGFGAFAAADVGAWTDRVLALSSVGWTDHSAFVGNLLSRESDAERASYADAFLLDRAPARDPRYDAVLAVVEAIQTDPTLTTVEMAARRHAWSERTLQRLFRRYVGVGPKWVLQRARLHDAVERIDAGDTADLSSLALELGWFDQSHFTRDFSALVGQSPAAYAARRR